MSGLPGSATAPKSRVAMPHLKHERKVALKVSGPWAAPGGRRPPVYYRRRRGGCVSASREMRAFADLATRPILQSMPDVSYAVEAPEAPARSGG
jgi:hypothetical protein